MITGIQALFYSSDADQLGNFFQEKLGFEPIENKEGCFIFNTPKANIVAHPSLAIGRTSSGTNLISFCCDDIEQTVKELQEKGVEFKGEILDHGYGLVIFFKVPGDFYIQLLQPKSERVV